MSSTHELKDVIKDTLENKGTLGQIKARIRAEVFNALNDESENKPQLSNENLIINELIREYLDFNKYRYSSSVLVAESGQPNVPLDRGFLSRELNIREDRNSSSVPLLYGLVSTYLKENRKPTGREASPQRNQGPGRGAFLEQLRQDLGQREDEDAVIIKR
ncbi:centrosomal protein 20-like [Mytilus trossulus]|uniref:centrosomal protein 20-like n=1 Tax=Mytilus trossulus TaxID=6551 RepID=UPI003003FB68